MRTTPIRTAVFIHGAGGGGWEWAIWARVFGAGGWAVLAPDLHAASAGLAATRLTDYAEQVRGWSAPHDRPVLIGASLGARLALETADLAAALVLINPLLPRTDATPRSAIVPWGAQRRIQTTRRAMPDADDAACLFAFRRWRNESGAVLDDAFAMPLPPAPRCPLLALAGSEDTDTPADNTRIWADAAGAEFRRVVGASHVGPLLGRDAACCAAAAIDWLSSAS